MKRLLKFKKNYYLVIFLLLGIIITAISFLMASLNTNKPVTIAKQQAVLAAQTLKPTPTSILTPTPTIAIPTPTASPSVATSQPSSGIKLFGVNMAGGDFGEDNLPGNGNYIYPSDQTSFNYFANHGLTIIRVPFRWERVQHTAMGDLNQPDIDGLNATVATASNANEKVILDMHNYGRYFNTPLTLSDSTKFADVWRKLADTFKDNPALFGYEIMNEPHDLPDGTNEWASLAQSATDAIRQLDTTHYIIIPGYDWQSANGWPENNQNLNINDATGKILYSAHQYFDSDQSGRYSEGYDAEQANPNTGVTLIQPFLTWLAANNKQGIFTEYGIPGDDPRWLTMLDNFLARLNSNPNIVGGTYWAAGPWWGDYKLSVEPQNGSDKPQMSILQKYKSR